MSAQARSLILILTTIVVGIYFFFSLLIKGQPFFAPLSIAVLLTLLMVPVSNKLESWGFGRGWAALVCILVLMAFVTGLFFVVSAQVKAAAEQWPEMKEKVKPKIEQLQQFIEEHTGMSQAAQNEEMKGSLPGGSSSDQSSGGESRASGDSVSGSQKEITKGEEERSRDQGGDRSGGENESPGSREESSANQEEDTSASSREQASDSREEKPGSKEDSGSEEERSGEEESSGGQSGGPVTSVLQSAAKAVWGFVGFLGTSLLTFVYIFFLLLYRTHFEKGILKFIPPERKDAGKKTLRDIGEVTQKYLVGKLMLIVFLAILYTVGLSISGVEHAILISILAAVLSLVPYVGNMVGLVLALALGSFSGGGSGAIVGIFATYTVAQFVESYILEPYIVGQRVDIHPVFTILAVIAGGEVWGIVGMVIAIPMLAIVKVICDHVPVLAPVGFLLGEEHKKKSSGKSDNFFQKVKRKFTR